MVLEFLRKWLAARRRSSRLELEPDRVWTSSQARFDGIREELDARSANGATIIALAAHFPDVLAELERIAAGYRGSTPVRAILAGQLSRETAQSLRLGETDVFDLLVAERHPLRSVDEELVRFAEGLPCRCRIVHHLSLDDPLLRRFGSESIRATLDRLGGTAEEPITHRLVTLSIQRAQKRIEANSSGQYDANSAAAWLERNT